MAKYTATTKAAASGLGKRLWLGGPYPVSGSLIAPTGGMSAAPSTTFERGDPALASADVGVTGAAVATGEGVGDGVADVVRLLMGVAVGVGVDAGANEAAATPYTMRM